MMRLLSICKSKIHRATVTDANVDYVGSIAIDTELMKRVGLLPNERVHVWNITNGSRIETYAIPAEPGSGMVCLNGAAAHHAALGDKVIIAAFCWTDEPEDPLMILVDDHNRFVTFLHTEPPATVLEV
jgi:aspartate 1-decarboxylase